LAIEFLVQSKLVAQEIQLRLERPSLHVLVEIGEVGILVIGLVEWRDTVGAAEKFNQRGLAGSHVARDRN
jgi:hypothetical protein